MSDGTRAEPETRSGTDFVTDRERAFAARRDALGAERSWLAAKRAEAMARFAELGLPTRSLEEWRYTNVGAIAKGAFESPTTSADVRVPAEDLADAWQAVFVDGHFVADRSQLPDDGGIRFHALSEARLAGAQAGEIVDAHLTRIADDKHDAFTALNTAFIDDGAVIEIATNAAADRPLHLRFFTSNGADASAPQAVNQPQALDQPQALTHPRVLVVARAGSRATVVEEHASLATSASFSNSVTELVVEANAQLDWVLVENENDASLHVSNVQASIARDARLRAHTLTLGGALTRNEAGILLADTGAEVDLRALFLVSGERHVDNHTLVDHAMPHCTSRELYKGVMSDRGRGVFRGRVIVRPDAQKTDANQSNTNLLLSDHSEIDTKPQLEIYADDVKCSHGSTIGQLDEEAVFYLRSRGIAADLARIMLTRGFANEIIDALPGDDLRGWLGGLAADRLERLLAPGEGSR